MLKSFLAGLGIGIGLGVLFAPMRGEDARETLTARANEMAGAAKNQYQQVRNRTVATISAIRGDEVKTGTRG